MARATPRTMYDKIWDAHLVDMQEDGTGLLYIDRHLVHEVTSPQAFEGLRMSKRGVRAPEKTLAVADHKVEIIDGTHTAAEHLAHTLDIQNAHGTPLRAEAARERAAADHATGEQQGEEGRDPQDHRQNRAVLDHRLVVDK